MRHTSILHKRILRERKMSSFGPVKTEKTSDGGDLRNYTGVEFVLAHGASQNQIEEFPKLVERSGKLLRQQLVAEVETGYDPISNDFRLYLYPVLDTEADAIIEASMRLSEVQSAKRIGLPPGCEPKPRSNTETTN